MLLFALSTALALPHLDGKNCATLPQLQNALPLLRQEDIPRIQGHKSGKEERDAVCDCPSALYSENFVVKWGTGVSESDAQDLLDAFETAWRVEVEELNYLPPTATDQYYFNIYIGDTGSGTPPGHGAAGYFTGDSEGYPMIVISSDTVGSENMGMVVAHEFFHAIQGRVYRYTYDETGPSAWYWEATANWAEGEVYPGTASMAGFLIGYSFFPHLPVNYFNYPDSGTLDEYHQYGAFIFPLHLTEVEADRELIWDSWNDQGSEIDPMAVLDRYLEGYGTNINEAWLNHIAHMSVWDYELGNIFQQTVLAYQDYYPEGENLIAKQVQGDGTGGWIDGPLDLQPMRYGHNTILATNLNDSAVTFGVRGESNGTFGTLAEYGATLTRKRSGSVEYFPLSFTDNEAQLSLDDVSSSDEYYVTIGAWTDTWTPAHIYAETFPFQLFIGSETEVNEPSGEPVSEPAGEPGSEPSGELSDEEDGKLFANCSTVDPLSGWAIIGVLGFLSRRRRD